ncbi:centromere protein Q isoform X2 [Hemicordylus capensis]|uniref:centromere protein Q isoform X2 n=1 Tax=Hemicordylus capensis TaxID=884348 RepID=UPI0023025487|nr:centromere protein Q isoform X2 [Hemicordylus capensis]
MKVKASQDQPESSGKKKGKGEKRKRNPEREQGTQAVRKKRMQLRTESPEETTSSHTKVVKVTPGQRAKWQPLSKSAKVHLESMMKWLIISLLYENTLNHREVEMHLNILKERLLKRFETLRVPVEKLKSLEKIHRILAEEKKKSAALEEGLAELEEEIDKAVQAAELREQNIQSLHNKIQELKRELAAEEETASELLQRNDSDDLALPELPKQSIKAPMFQEQILKIQNQESILKNLNTILQSEEMKISLEKACKKVDS